MEAVLRLLEFTWKFHSNGNFHNKSFYHNLLKILSENNKHAVKYYTLGNMSLLRQT